MASSPDPPSMRSAPPRVVTRSSPPRAQTVSFPPLPSIVSLPEEPAMTSSPGVPVMVPDPVMVAVSPRHVWAAAAGEVASSDAARATARRAELAATDRVRMRALPRCPPSDVGRAGYEARRGSCGSAGHGPGPSERTPILAHAPWRAPSLEVPIVGGGRRGRSARAAVEWTGLCGEGPLPHRAVLGRRRWVGRRCGGLGDLRRGRLGRGGRRRRGGEHDGGLRGRARRCGR